MLCPKADNMKTNKANYYRAGFTVTELSAAIATTVIIVAAFAMALISGHRTLNVTYAKVYSDVRTNAEVVLRRFDALVRKSVNGQAVIASQEQLEICYFNDSDSTFADRYAILYESDGDMLVEYGTVTSVGIKSTTSVETLCGDVSSCEFSISGKSVEIVLALSDGEQSNTVISSAYLQN